VQRDSSAANAVFSGTAGFYQNALAGLPADPAALSAHPLKEYLAKIDSLQTTLEFLNLPRLSSSGLPTVGGLVGKLKVLQGQIQKANDVAAMVSERQQQLQTVLTKYNLSGYLSGYSQRAYYYKTQLQQYKDLLNQPDRLTGKVLGVVRNSAAFQSYFRSNSYLSTLFRVPGSTASGAAPSDTKLQTRDQVNALVAARLGNGANFATAVSEQSTSNNSGNPLAGSMGQAQSAMNSLKTKVAQVGGGSSNCPLPDFQPNSEHTKSFWKRLELGFNLQSTHATPFIPATTDLALSLGYKVCDRLVAGVGGGYKLGWGQPFEHLSLSGQGASLRSFLNWKIKGSWWIAGGYEYNYFSALYALTQLAPLQAWQQSGLIGLQKTYKAGKRTGNIQLLWNFLYEQQLPRPQPLVFRVGYTL
jgi:hypothetical protein